MTGKGRDTRRRGSRGLRHPVTLTHLCGRDACALLCDMRPPPSVTRVNIERFTDPPHATSLRLLMGDECSPQRTSPDTPRQKRRARLVPGSHTRGHAAGFWEERETHASPCEPSRYRGRWPGLTPNLPGNGPETYGTTRFAALC